jgi:hypothetical protein
MPFASLEHGPTKCKHFGAKAMRSLQNGPTKCKHFGAKAMRSLQNGPTKCKHFGVKAMRSLQNGPTKYRHSAEEGGTSCGFKNSVTRAPDGLELPPNVLELTWRRTHIQNNFQSVVSKYRFPSDPVPPRP